MTRRMFFWTDTGKWVKKKLNLNVYFLWMPVSRLADPCFPVYLVLWSTEVCTREFVLTSSCCWEHRSDFRSWAGHPENKEHKSLARWEHFSLWLWNSTEKEKCSRCRNRTQFSRATFNRLHCKTTVIFLQLPASFIIHFPILTNKQSGNPIGKRLHALDSSLRHTASLCSEWGKHTLLKICMILQLDIALKYTCVTEARLKCRDISYILCARFYS